MNKILLFVMVLSIMVSCKSQADRDYDKVLDLWKNDRCDEAIQLATKSIETNPNDSRFYALRGACYYAEQKIEVARPDIEKCLRLKNGNPWCTAWMGLINEAEGHIESAEEDLKKAITLEHNKRSQSLYYRYLGDFYFRSKKDVPLATAQYDEALRLNMSNGPAYYNMGSVLFAANEKEFAEQRWLKGLKIADYDEIKFKHLTYYGLAYLYFERRDFWKAKDMIKKALELAPSNEQYLRFSKTITEQLKS